MHRSADYRTVIGVSGLRCPEPQGISIWERIFGLSHTSHLELPGILVRIFVDHKRFETKAVEWSRNIGWDENFDLCVPEPYFIEKFMR